MNQYEKDILNLLKDKFIKKFGECEFRLGSEGLGYWLKDYEKNLIYPMNDAAKSAYDDGAGGEIQSGKIGALKSSSALTYNLFHNEKANIILPKHKISKGIYSVEFEKKFSTIKGSGMRAHLDAFLYCDAINEAIACEMKMTEWLFNAPSALSASYLKPEKYIDNGLTFASVARALVGDCEESCAKYKPIFTSYDGCQMFKHAISLYRACYEYKIPRKTKRLTLLNCVWTLPHSDFLSNEASKRKYAESWKKEMEEFKYFKALMQPIKELFALTLKIDFDIELCTFKETVEMLEKPRNELIYYERYFI